MYRVGFPFWKIAARIGVTMLIRVDIFKDKEAGVFVATSPDLKGLVAEAKTVEELFIAVNECTDMLMEEAIDKPIKHRPVAAWVGECISA
jgi:predicted RNase H-like HicB family nuclease